jgi:hypothetical protein
VYTRAVRRRLLPLLALLLLAPLACSSGDDEGADPQAFCDQLESVTEDVQAAGRDDVGEDDPEEAVRFLRQVADRLAEAEPPDAIDDAYDTYVDAADDLASALEGVDASDEEAATQALTEFARDHVEDLDAGEAVSDYLDEECGVTFEDPLGG